MRTPVLLRHLRFFRIIIIYKFARFARQFAIGYNDERTVYVLEHMKYKKSTIAFMKKILDMYKVENSLQKYLSYASRYKVPPVQRIAKH